MKRPQIRIKLVDRLGRCGCHHGHKVGDVFDYDTQRGELCPMAAHVAFPYVEILRYGGGGAYYSHSIVAGGLLVISYITRFTWLTSLMILLVTFCNTS